MSPSSSNDLSEARAEELLLELYLGILGATRSALLDALAQGSTDRLSRPAGEGVGDVTYGLDLPSEELLSAWLEQQAQRGPISLLTEDAGWRHRGPGASGDTVELEGFDHGGPRVVVDPVDGTRNLMADMRSAWCVLAWAPPGPSAPRMSDLRVGLLGELPDSRAARARVFRAVVGCGCRLAELELGGELGAERALEVGAAAHTDHGFFPFFSYDPRQRVQLAELNQAFLDRLAEHEGADTRHCFDDQYISNGGQLALLAQGTYRAIFDLRAHLWELNGERAVTSKPYDLAGAVLCAREAGCALRGPAGEELDFPLDATTPVAWVGWCNEATRARLEPHLAEAMRATLPGTRA